MDADLSAADQAIRDRIYAYTLAAESMPTTRHWWRAIRSRDDGSTARGVLAVLHVLRADLMARIGELYVDASLAPESLPGSESRIHSTKQDCTAALEIALDHVPHADDWAAAWRQRDDGISLEGVKAGLAEIRRDFYARLGDLQATADASSGSNHPT